MFAYCLNNHEFYKDDDGEAVEVIIGEESFSYNYGNFKITVTITVSASAGPWEHATVSFSRNGTSLYFSITDKELGCRDYSVNSVFCPSAQNYGTIRNQDQTTSSIYFGVFEAGFSVSQDIDDYLSFSASVSITNIAAYRNAARAFTGFIGYPSIGTGNSAAFSSSGAPYLMFSIGGNVFTRISYMLV